MAIKYISQNKKGDWKVSTTKTGKAVKNLPTQKEAIAYAATIKDTDAIMIKRASGWALASSWDQSTISKAKEVEKNSKAQGVSTKHAKETAVEKATKPSLELTPKQKAEVSQFNHRRFWFITIVFLCLAGVLAALLYETFTQWT